MYYNINLDKIKEIISFPVRKVIPKFVCYTVCDVEFSKQKTLKALFSVLEFFTFSSASQEPSGQFQPNLAKSLGNRGF